MTVGEIAEALRVRARELAGDRRDIAFALVVAETGRGGEIEVTSNLDAQSLDNLLCDGIELTRRKLIEVTR